ncbi:MAG: FAD-dependent oxidoreductase [Woeseia sp.]
MKIAIIGAGWFGCHIASVLIEEGFDVTIFEKEASIFGKASGYNQYRLHMGFHYPRSYDTRKQTIIGFEKFVNTYPGFSAAIDHNIYGIVSKHSLIDFPTYKDIMRATGLPFEEVDPKNFGLDNVEGAIRCDERLIDTEGAKEHFDARLKNNLALGHPVHKLEGKSSRCLVDGIPYDFVVDCTWCAFENRAGGDLFYEPTVTLLYSSKMQNTAITLMDGAFFSLYPFKKDLSTLTSVAQTPRGRYTHYEAARRYLEKVDFEYIRNVQELMEKEVEGFFPAFHDYFQCSGYYLAIKTKISDATDKRFCSVTKSGRIITVISGKIDSIFVAAEEVMAIIDSRIADADRQMDRSIHVATGTRGNCK